MFAKITIIITIILYLKISCIGVDINKPPSFEGWSMHMKIVCMY